MKRKLILMSMLVLTFTPLCAAADGDTDDEEDKKEDVRIPLLKITVGKTNQVTIAVPSITSVAQHSYLLNGVTPISQVTIDTTGNNTIRFYCVHPDELGKDPAALAKVLSPDTIHPKRNGITPGGKSSGLPSVKFPEGTYSHSIEFQLEAPEQLTKLYKAATSVWNSTSPKTVKIHL